MIHRPIGGGKTADSGAAGGMAGFTRHRSRNCNMARRLALHRCITHFRITRLQVTAGAIRNISVSRVIHRPARCREPARAGAGNRVTRLACSCSCDVGSGLSFNQRSSHLAIARLQVACRATRCNTGMIHGPIGSCKPAHWPHARGRSGMARLAGQRG